MTMASLEVGLEDARAGCFRVDLFAAVPEAVRFEENTSFACFIGSVDLAVVVFRGGMVVRDKYQSKTATS